MIRFQGRSILLDIEGTTSSIRFVYDEMFPYVRQHLAGFLNDHLGREAVEQAIAQMAEDQRVEQKTLFGDPGSDDYAERVGSHVLQLMDNDSKTTGLKKLQGLIWKDGFESGALQAHVYDDVPTALQQWRSSGLEVRIYSSGSVAAQKLFFGYSIHGDLLHHFSSHYDTEIGSKREAESYRKIAADCQQEASQILFLSDVTAELDAAREAGLATGLAVRPGNQPVSDDEHPQITDFGQIQIAS